MLIFEFLSSYTCYDDNSNEIYEKLSSYTQYEDSFSLIDEFLSSYARYEDNSNELIYFWLYNICWGCPTIFMQKNTRIYPILLYLNCRETSREMEMRVYGFKLSFSRLKGWVGKNVKEVR